MERKNYEPIEMYSLQQLSKLVVDYIFKLYLINNERISDN